MKELSCEEVLMSQMAAADGEASTFANEQVAAHLAVCANCQHELKQARALDQLLVGQTLSEQRVDLWPAIEVRIEDRIAKRTTSMLGWRPFALVGLLLVVYKLLEMLPAQPPRLAFKLVPLIIVVLLFVLIRENPFRINTELVLER